jgi:hypothetical protein
MLLSNTDSCWFTWLRGGTELMHPAMLMCAAVSKIYRGVPPEYWKTRICEFNSLPSASRERTPLRRSDDGRNTIIPSCCNWSHPAPSCRQLRSCFLNYYFSHLMTCVFTEFIHLFIKIHKMRHPIEIFFFIFTLELDVWGSGCIDPYYLDHGTSWRWVISFTPLSLYRGGKSTWYPLDMRLSGPQRRSGRLGKEKILDRTGIRTPTLPSFSPQPVAILTTISRPILAQCLISSAGGRICLCPLVLVFTNY